MYLTNWDRIGQDEYRAYQADTLHKFLKNQVLKYSPFYRDMFKSNGLSADDIRKFEDIEKIPFSSKVNIAPTREAPDKARHIVLQPDPATFASTIGLGKKLSLLGNQVFKGATLREQLLDEYLPIFFIATTGRTANPTPFLYTHRDHQMFTEASRRLFTITGIERTRDFAFSAFPYAPHLAFWIVYQGGITTKVPMFHTGGGKVFGTDRIIPAIERFNATVLVGIPGYIYHILRTAAEKGANYSKVRMVALGAERVTPGLKKSLKEMLESMGAKDPIILSTLGFTEARVAWVECPHGSSITESSGYHLYPDMEIMEIVDPDTGKVMGDGESGELVYTALDWRGSVVLRYRTGDYCNGGITWKQCPYCGRKVPRLTSNITRMSDRGELNLSKIKGTLVDFNEFFPIFTEVPDIVEWQIEVTKRNEDPHDLDEVHAYVAVKPGVNQDDFAKVIQKKVFERMELNVAKVHFLSPEEMAKRLGMDDKPKETRIFDRRPELEAKEAGG